MRLLYITAETPFGKEEAFVIPEVREVMRRGHEVLIVPRHPPGDHAGSSAPELRALSLKEPLISPKIVGGAIAEVVSHPVRSLRATAAALLTTNGLAFLRNLAVLPKALWLARICRKWKPDHIHAHWASTMSTMAMVVGELTDIPWSFTAHRGDIVRSNLFARKESRASFVRFISRSGIELARARGARAEGDKAVVIHMGAVLPSHRQGQTAADPSKIVCAAHLVPVKGHRCLLQAAQLLKRRGIRFSLAIAGDGPLMGELQLLAKSLDLDDCVQFLGHLTHGALLALYRDQMVGTAVLPSVDLGDGLHEGIPVALMEAMAHGIPVVSTTTGGIPELLHDGAGIMVAPNDPAALADGLQQALCDSELRRELAQAGQRRVEEDFSIENVMTQLLHRIETTITPDNDA